jgi:hypothetical protein
MGLLESTGFAMPGIGFLLGGLVAYLLNPRASFVLAGCGVLAVLAIAIPLIRRTGWTGDEPPGGGEAEDQEEDQEKRQEKHQEADSPPVGAHGVRPQTVADSID